MLAVRTPIRKAPMLALVSGLPRDKKVTLIATTDGGKEAPVAT
jgi:hypothetical protein